MRGACCFNNRQETRNVYKVLAYFREPCAQTKLVDFGGIAFLFSSSKILSL